MHDAGRHASGGAAGSSWFTKPPRPDDHAPRATRPVEGPGHDPAPPASGYGGQTAEHGDRLRLVESLRECAKKVWWLAERLSGRRGGLEPVVVDLAEVAAALTRCCRLLEADAAGYQPRAQRRMVQATGHAEALTGRLADPLSALQ